MTEDWAQLFRFQGWLSDLQWIFQICRDDQERDGSEGSEASEKSMSYPKNADVCKCDQLFQYFGRCLEYYACLHMFEHNRTTLTTVIQRRLHPVPSEGWVWMDWEGMTCMTTWCAIPTSLWVLRSSIVCSILPNAVSFSATCNLCHLIWTSFRLYSCSIKDQSVNLSIWFYFIHFQPISGLLKTPSLFVSPQIWGLGSCDRRKRRRRRRRPSPSSSRQETNEPFWCFHNASWWFVYHIV